MGNKERKAQLTQDIEVLVRDGSDAALIAIDGSGVEQTTVPPGVEDLIAQVADAVVPAASRTRPDKIGVEFGIAVSNRTGQPYLTADPARATFRVFMEWTAGSRQHDG